MEQKTDRVYPSAPFEKKFFDVEQRLEKKLNDLKSLNISNINIQGMITYFKDKNQKLKNKYKKHKTVSTILKTLDTEVFTATTSSFITLSDTGFGLIAIPKSTATACKLSICNKVISETIMQKHSQYKKQCEKDQKTIENFENLYRKSLQENVIHKIDYEPLCKILLNIWMK